VYVCGIIIWRSELEYEQWLKQRLIFKQVLFRLVLVHALASSSCGAGMDELGVLIAGHSKNAYWYGSQLTIEEARRVAPHNNATSLQV
jgi:hypothetical protein